MQIPSFHSILARHQLELTRAKTRTAQINLGKKCNQACLHCHVEAGPTRTEMMEEPTLTRLLTLLERSPGIDLVDITGGAPELHPQFQDLVRGIRDLDKRVMLRCNLTVLLEPGQEETPEFLKDHGVHIVASLPCYGPDNVNRQRGRGVFEASIQALKKLNALGYGMSGEGRLPLDLMYNPSGPFLPGPQAELERAYKQELSQAYGVHFHRLLTLANQPIARFRRDLERSGRLEAYMQLLKEHFNGETVEKLMCRTLISVSYDGRLFDCDFNQMLDLSGHAPRQTLWDIESFDMWEGQQVRTGEHCYACTAGQGSSCGGSLST